jgi:beta-mannosidase
MLGTKMSAALKDNILLNGQWNFLPDIEGIFNYQDVASLELSNKIYDNSKVPTNWELAGLHNFNGTVWFIKRFDAEINKKLVVLLFKGIDYFSEVWLNDICLGLHEGYFQQFSFHVSDIIKKKDNLLIVKVTSPFEEPGTVWPLKKNLIKGIFNHHDCRPGGWSPQYGQDKNTGGIWNDVILIFRNNVIISSAKISSEINFAKNIAVVKSDLFYISNLDSPKNDIIKIEIISPSGSKKKLNIPVLLLPGNNMVSLVFEINNPELWWTWDLGNPSLYKMSLSGKLIEQQDFSFGIRDVKLDDNKVFYLNNKRLFLRGTNIIPEQFLSILDNKRIARQVKLIKEANINIIRMHAHVNRSEYYDECDKSGLLIWQDFPLQWTYNDSAEFRGNAVKQIKEMVIQHFNHPSIVFWCCHNEPGEQIKSLDPFLYSAVLSEDNTRIIRIASNYEEHPYDGWYWGSKEHFASIPMGPMVTEFGAQGLPNVKSLKKFIPVKKLWKPDWDFWKYHNFQYDQTFLIAQIDRGKSIDQFVFNSQAYQSELIQTAVDFYRRGKYDKVTALFQFMFIDCWPSITWSVIDYFESPKKAYYTLQKAFQPVYVSVKVRQKKYLSGSKLNLDLWIINDLHKEFQNCTIKFSLKGKEINKIKIDKIEKDSVRYISWENLQVYLPLKLKPAKYELNIELTSSNLLSDNNFEIEIEEMK